MGRELFTKAELAALAALRTRFFEGSNAGGGYWKSEEELALYDASLGERIGWKWDFVLDELKARGWKPAAKHVVDWGCGSGIAGRRVLAAWPGFESLTVTDVSPLAMRFAESRARTSFPQVVVQSKANATEAAKDALLLVSHVLNETDETGAERIVEAARGASEIIWIEAGTHADSRRLITVREHLRGQFEVVAPCTHRAACGMLAAENSRHWCHHFARVPSEASRDARWAQFGRELGIDMRALPCSFLVLARSGMLWENVRGCSRIIGRPVEAKGRFDLLACSEEGVRELMLQKRDAPDLFKQLRKGRADTVLHLRCEGRRITQAESADSSTAQSEGASVPGQPTALPRRP